MAQVTDKREHLAAIDGLSHVRGEMLPPLWIETIP
jgi:hypothetical protein